MKGKQSYKEKYATCRLENTPGLSDAAGLMQLLHSDSFKFDFFFVLMVAIACIFENL